MDWGAIVQAASAAATVIAQQQAAKSAAKANQAAAQSRNDTINQQGYQGDLGRARGILDEQAAALAAPGRRAANAVRGDALANLQDATISGLPPGVTVPTISGGLRPSMFSGSTRALGQQMARDALLSQMAGSATPFSGMKAAPGATPLPQTSALDNILNNIGMYGSLAGAVAPSLLNRPATTTRPLTPSPAPVFDPSGLPTE